MPAPCPTWAVCSGRHCVLAPSCVSSPCPTLPTLLLPPSLPPQLREMIEGQEEWPELAQKCLSQKRKIDGET